MKKSLIIGASSLVLAAAPAISAFAASSNPAAVSDQLSVTVDEICTFERTVGNGNYSASMAANAFNASFGTSTFKAICNANSGYKVTGVFTALAGDPGGSIPYQTSLPSAGTNGWTAIKGAASATTYMTSNTAGNLISKSGADTSSGTTQQVSYKVATAANIAAGTYQGTATYTLIPN